MPITSSMPLYWGEYTGVYVYWNPNSVILSLLSPDLWNEMLSIINMTSSKKFSYLNLSRNYMNFLLFIDFLWISTSSIPLSLEMASITAYTSV